MKLLYNKKITSLISFVLLFLIWHIASSIINDSFLFPSPIDVIFELFHTIKNKNMLLIITNSVSNIMIGVFISYALAIVLSYLSLKFEIIYILLTPYITIIKSTPVASFIILCLIFLPIGKLSLFISFLMSFPIVYENLYNNILSVDNKLIEMSNIFGFSKIKKLVYIYLPHLKPTILTIVKLSIGLSFKAGIAAEVIGIPINTIGSLLYSAKIYLDTKQLLSITIIIVIVSFIIEIIMKKIIQLLYKCLFNIK